MNVPGEFVHKPPLVPNLAAHAIAILVKWTEIEQVRDEPHKAIPSSIGRRRRSATGGRAIVPVDVIVGHHMGFGSMLQRLGNLLMAAAGSAGCPKLALGFGIHRLLVVPESEVSDDEGLHDVLLCVEHRPSMLEPL